MYTVHSVIYVISENIFIDEFIDGPDFKCIIQHCLEQTRPLQHLYLVLEIDLYLLQDFAKFYQTTRRQLAVKNPI